MSPSRRLILLCAWLALALGAGAESLAEFLLLRQAQITPEGGLATFGGERLYGRVHVNREGYFSPNWEWNALFRYSQSDPLQDWPVPIVLPEGVCIPHAPLDFDFDAELQAIRAACLPAHRWAATLDSLPLTTWLRFDGPVYHAAQFCPSQVNGTDTLYTVPWTTLPLPGPAEPQLIWVQGVARVKGVVEGQVTLLASDSLFIMGDLLVADTILEPCGGDPPGEGTLFGTVPADSPNRIGLIGERDVILAATLENGFANGKYTPAVDCGWPNDPVVTVCGQGRQDVILTAAVLALGCTVESEFWKSTAWGATIPPVSWQTEGCPGQNNTHVTLWDTTPGGERPDCPGADALSDRRGTFWLCGSLSTVLAGYGARNPVGPWGDAMIGYMQKALRFDENLLSQAPPFWPPAVWILQDSLETVWQTAAGSACGAVDPALFLADWNSGALGLEITAPEFGGQQNTAHGQVVLWVNGQPVDSTRFSADESHPFHWTPAFRLQPFLEDAGAAWLEVQQGDFWGASQPLEIHHTWNAGGADCRWSWQSTGVAPVAPAGFRLSPPWPNPFNPTCQVELSLPAPGFVRLEVFDLLGRREALLHDGELAAGTHGFTLDGSRWAAGLHLLRLSHAGGLETRKLLLLK